MRYVWLVGLVSLQGCFFQAPQLGCQTTATQPMVHTLSWSPTWSSYDMDINQRGEFYFSPLKDVKGTVPTDTLYQVQLDGTRTAIKLRPDSFDPPNVTTGTGSILLSSPGNLAVFGDAVWVSGSTWLKKPGTEGIVQEFQLIRVQPHSFLPSLEVWRPAESENAPSTPLFSISNTEVYTVTPCSILRIARTPPSQKLFMSESAPPEGDCAPIRLKYAAISPAERFYASAPGPDEYPVEKDKQRYQKTFYQIFRMTAGKMESWAGSSESGFKDGSRDQARFAEPMGLAAARDETVYVADRANHAIRKISPTGNVTTLIGNGQPGRADGSTEIAQLDSPYDVMLGPCHKLYAFDKNGIREISLPPDASAERWGDPVTNPG